MNYRLLNENSFDRNYKQIFYFFHNDLLRNLFDRHMYYLLNIVRHSNI